MFSNKFVASVLDDRGDVIKERVDGIVRLPFNSVYSLKFRNKHDRRAVVKFFIDGENVSGSGYVIPANDSITIKRHLDRDAEFKFVELESSEAQAAGKSGPNEDGRKGVIEAQFYLEKEPPKPPQYVPYPVPTPYVPPWTPPWKPTWTAPSSGQPTQIGCSDNLGYTKGAVGGPRGQSVSAGSAEAAPDFGCWGPQKFGASLAPGAAFKGSEEKTSGGITLNNAALEGCTVKGAATGQTFGTTHIDLETTYTSITLVLKGYHVEADPPASAGPVKNDYCTQCGRKRTKANKFCGSCGQKF